MDLIIFFLKRKLLSFYRVDNWKSILGTFLLGAILMLYAVGLGVLYNFSLIRHSTHISASIITGAQAVLMVLPISLKFFPSISWKKTIVPSNYPISNLRIAMVDFLSAFFLKSVHWILFFFVLVFSLVSAKLNFIEVFTLFSLWIIGFLFAENLINAITWRKYLHLVFLAISLSGLVIFIIFPTKLPISRNEICVILILYILFLLGSFFLFYDRQFNMRHVGTHKHLDNDKLKLNRYLSVKLLYQNRVSKVALIFALSIKAGFLILFLSNSNRYSFAEILHRVPFILVFNSPVILFTYCFNNLWGYFIDVEFNTIIANPSFKKQFNIYLSFLAVALMIDFTVAQGIFFYFHLLTYRVFLIYVVLAIYCVPIGFLSSFRKYFLVDLSFTFMNFRAKTSVFYSFLLMVPGFLIGFFYDYTGYQIAFLCFILATSFMMFFYAKKYYHLHFKKLKESIFKTNAAALKVP